MNQEQGKRLMEFDYKEFGEILAWHRNQKHLRQVDLEVRSGHRLKQPAISAAEHGETRLAVDTLIQYCNALGVGAEIILAPFMEVRQETEESGAIVDPYVIEMAKIMEDCSPETKLSMLEIAAVIKKQTCRYESELLALSDHLRELEAGTHDEVK